MSRLTVCAPLRLEARALRRGLGAGSADGPASPGGEADADCQVRVVRTGYGPARAAAAATRIARAAGPASTPLAAAAAAASPAAPGPAAAPGPRAVPGPLAVGGVAAALTSDLAVGDIVVATEVSDGSVTIACPSAPLLAGELRRAGLRVQTGRIVTVGQLVRQGQHAALAAATGAIAADMESAPLLAAAAAPGQPVAVVRAISDTPGHRMVHPATVTGGIAALRALRQAGPVLSRWAAATAVAPRTILLASPRSFCAGVERAIEIVELALEQYGAPVYVRKQIVHNATVVAELERHGAIFVDELDEVPDEAHVVFSAHGVAPDVRREAARRGLEAVDATCPLVAKVHAEARRYAADGYLVALIGHAGHEEVEGTMGEARRSMALVQHPADVAGLEPDDPARVAYLMQTTLAADEASGVVDAIRARFPAATGPGTDDICYATTNRQRAVRAVAERSDLVIVAGSVNSSNSRRLVETAERTGTPAYLVDSAQDIHLGWLAGAATIGIAAGASAPPAIVGQIVAALAGLSEVHSEEVVVTTETVQFGLPKELRKQPVGSAES